MSKIFIIGVLALIGINAHAKQLSLIEVTAQDYPDDPPYHLGLDVDDNNRIVDIYYEDQSRENPDLRMLRFKPADIVNESGVLMTKKGRDVVKMSAQPESSTSATVTLEYLKSGISGNWGSADFKVSIDPVTNHYKVVDLRSKKEVNAAYVSSNILWGKTIGISGIRTSLKKSVDSE